MKQQWNTTNEKNEQKKNIKQIGEKFESGRSTKKKRHYNLFENSNKFFLEKKKGNNIQKFFWQMLNSFCYYMITLYNFFTGHYTIKTL